MRNFKKETVTMLKKYFGARYKIDQYRFKHYCSVSEGEDKIDWAKVKKDLMLNSDYEYDDGFGVDDITGFITIKGKDSWLERSEYDGSSWWLFKSRPKLTKNLEGIKHD